MKLLVIENNQVCVEDKDDNTVAIWSVEDFMQQFNITIPANLIKLNYEPDRNLFHVIYDHIDNVRSLKSPDEDDLMQLLASIFDNALVVAKDKVKDDKIVNSEIAKLRKQVIMDLKTQGKIRQDYY